MSGYTKLYRSILNSTIWQESKETRLVWITLLALSEMDGAVECSIPGLAKEAGVSIPECESALAVLLAPDPYSRTKDYEGRRIQVVDGGWKILNRDKYRDRRDDRAAYYRQYRAQQCAQQLDGCAQQKRTQTETETETETGKIKNTVASATDIVFEEARKLFPANKRGMRGGDSPDFVSFWTAYPRKVAKDEARKAWKKIKTPATLLPMMLSAVAAWLKSDQWTKDGGAFIPHPATWLNQGRWEDEPPAERKIDSGPKLASEVLAEMRAKEAQNG